MKLEIITPEKHIFEGEADLVQSLTLRFFIDESNFDMPEISCSAIS